MLYADDNVGWVRALVLAIGTASLKTFLATMSIQSV
jgi:hypothetical protein